MSAIYCKKCGLRGDSKCPHCRSIFADRNPHDIFNSQEVLEGFLTVTRMMRYETSVNVTDENGKEVIGKHGYVEQKTLYADEPAGKDGQARYLVGMWTYAHDSSEALQKVLRRFAECLRDENVVFEVAACVHEWELMPGIASSIDCGHVGPQADVPADPYAKFK